MNVVKYGEQEAVSNEQWQQDKEESHFFSLFYYLMQAKRIFAPYIGYGNKKSAG
jgi:hypothetical protein